MKETKKELEAAFDSLSDQDLGEVLRALRQFGCLEGPAAGIARQIENQGRESLTVNQRWRFFEDGWHPYVALACECGQVLQPDEMVLAPQMNSGRCSYCQHRWEKLQEE